MRLSEVFSCARAWLLAALCFGGAPMRAAAQDTAVVFVHGIASDASVWYYMLTTLQQDLRINPVQPNLDWTRPVAQQAGDLSAYLNAHPATSDPARWMPFVGRSNGGLDSREYSRTGGRLRQLATIGTPHLGTLLANNWLNGNVLDVGFYTGDALWTPIQFYANEDMAIPDIVRLAIESVPPFMDFAYNLHANLCYDEVGLCLIEAGGSWVAAPVIYDLQAGSDATAQLNTDQNLNREAATTTARVGIRTAVNPQGAVFDLLGYHAPSWVDARDLLTVAYMLAYDHYHHHWDPFLQMYAGLWVDGAVALIDMDMYWQFLIGTLWDWQLVMDADNGWWYAVMVSEPNDGVVPTSSQRYPGGTSNYYLQGVNISHTDQMTNAVVRNTLTVALERDFQTPPRQQPPPPPVSWAMISGPYLTRPGFPCHWTASSNVSGAGYEWFVNDVSTGTGLDFYYTAQSTFTLRVVASGGGGSASDSRSIEVNSAYGECLDQ